MQQKMLTILVVLVIFRPEMIGKCTKPLTMVQFFTVLVTLMLISYYAACCDPSTIPGRLYLIYGRTAYYFDRFGHDCYPF